MAGDPREQTERRQRTVRRAVVFLVVVVAAALLGRLGSGLDAGPMLEVEHPDGEGGAGVDRDAGAGPWRLLPDPGLAARDAHTAVWDGAAVLVWGGYGPFGSGDGLHADGAAYVVATDHWEAIPPAPLPGLVNHTAVWTGQEMLVWSGAGSGDRGAAYDPARGRWRLLSPDPLPDLQEHTAVWAGGEMLVWGGYGRPGGSPAAVRGAAYDPAADAWRLLPAAPDAGTRRAHTATWTGREMVVVGGSARGRESPTVAAQAYDPAAEAWRVLPDPPGGARDGHTAVWTGDLLLVWGGVGADGDLADPAGVAYDPAADAWSVLPDPAAGTRAGHAAAWTGAEMVVWGGVRPGRPRPAGLAYDPAGGRWRALPDPPLRPRVPPRLVWTGELLVVLDGRSFAPALASDLTAAGAPAG